MRSVFLISFFMFASFVSNAQEFHSFQLGMSIPTTEFSDPSKGGALVGPLVGYQFWFEIDGYTHLAMYAGVEFVYNTLSSKGKEHYEQLPPFMNTSFDKHRTYMNLPITAGLSWPMINNASVSLCIDAGVAFSFFNVTNSEMTSAEGNERVEHGGTNSFGFTGGLTSRINNRIGISLQYYLLGNQNYENRYVQASGEVLTFDKTTFRNTYLALKVSYIIPQKLKQIKYNNPN